MVYTQNCNEHDKMERFAKFKKILRRGLRATLNFQKFNLIILSYHASYNSVIKKWGSSSWLLSYKRLKLKLRVFLEGHIVAMVTYCVTKLTATCLPMIGQFADTMILASTGIEWL